MLVWTQYSTMNYRKVMTKLNVTYVDSHEITMYDIHETVCDTMSDTW